LVFNPIPYGFRFDVTANGAEGELRLGGVQRFTIQVKRASQGIFVMATTDMVLSILTMIPIERGSDGAKLWAQIVAQSKTNAGCSRYLLARFPLALLPSTTPRKSAPT
jgi:hypothetical protein